MHMFKHKTGACPKPFSYPTISVFKDYVSKEAYLKRFCSFLKRCDYSLEARRFE